MDETKKLSDDKDKMNAESVWNLILQLNQDKKWMEEMIGMGALRDLFQPEFDRYEERLKSKDEEIQSRDEEIRRTQEENNELKKIIEKMKKQLAVNVAGL